MFGNWLPGAFGIDRTNEMDERPKEGITSMTISIPDNASPETIRRIQQWAAEKQYLSSMSPREQLDYFKRKNGF